MANKKHGRSSKVKKRSSKSQYIKNLVSSRFKVNSNSNNTSKDTFISNSSIAECLQNPTNKTLENLPGAANAVDIKQFFQGISIPEGGVHINKEVAFIMFSTDEDARQAMQRDGGCIKGVQIKLLQNSHKMQNVLEEMDKESLDCEQMFMMILQQPQLPIIGSSLTTEVLPLSQQQVRSDRPVNILHMDQPILDPSRDIMTQEKQQNLLSKRSSENKDSGDNKNHKYKQTRLEFRAERSKERSYSGSGSRRTMSRFRDRSHGRDQSHGIDRPRYRHRSRSDRDSSTGGNGLKLYRSQSPRNKPMNGGKVMVGYQQTCQKLLNSECTALGGDECQQQPYGPDNNFQGNGYNEGNNDKNDRHSIFGNNFHTIFNNTFSTPAMIKYPVQYYRHQQGYDPNNKSPRINKRLKRNRTQNNRSSGHQPLNDFGGSGGPRFNNHQQQPIYIDRSGGNVDNPQNSVVRQSRISSIHESGRHSRFNPMPQSKNDRASDPNFDIVIKNLYDRAYKREDTDDCGNSDEQLSTASQQEQPTEYLKLLQLPITVTKQDVINKFDDVQRVNFYPDGEFWRVVLEFQSVDAAEATLKRFPCVLLGLASVPILRCTYNEYTLIKRQTLGEGRRFTSSDTRSHCHLHNQHHPPSTSRPPQTASLQPPSPLLRSNCVHVYNLPTTVTNVDMIQFFTTIPDKIHLMLSKFVPHAVESFCEFNTVQKAHAALAKNQCFMGPNIVYVKLIGRPAMIQAILKPINNYHQNISRGGGMCGGGDSNGGPPRPQQRYVDQDLIQTPDQMDSNSLVAINYG